MSGGSRNDGPYSDVKPAELTRKLDEQSEELADGFIPVLDEILQTKLSVFNRRDSDSMNKRRDKIKNILSDFLDTTWDMSYGGSVAKNTYLDGLSDVDSLLIMKDGNTNHLKPSEIRNPIAERLKKQLDGAHITTGTLAITIVYSDDMEIQLVPAVRDGENFRVPSWTGDQWSRINPQKFRDALSKRNEACNGRLIPTIKLAKGIISTWPESVRLSGYHVESLAIDAFRSYLGDKTVSKMLPFFFDKATTSVLSPIRDQTGQSVNVDTYLGKSQSIERKKISHWCSQTTKKMRRASVQGSRSQWEELFE